MVSKPLHPDTRKLPPREEGWAGQGLGEGVSVAQGKVGGTSRTLSVLPGGGGSREQSLSIHGDAVRPRTHPHSLHPPGTGSSTSFSVNNRTAKR